MLLSLRYLKCLFKLRYLKIKLVSIYSKLCETYLSTVNLPIFKLQTNIYFNTNQYSSYKRFSMYTQILSPTCQNDLSCSNRSFSIESRTVFGIDSKNGNARLKLKTRLKPSYRTIYGVREPIEKVSIF